MRQKRFLRSGEGLVNLLRVANDQQHADLFKVLSGLN